GVGPQQLVLPLACAQGRGERLRLQAGALDDEPARPGGVHGEAVEPPGGRGRVLLGKRQDLHGHRQAVGKARVLVQLNGLTANHTAQVYLHGLPPLGRVPFAGRWPDLPCGGKVRALMTLVMATGGRSVTAWPSIPRSEEHTSELQSRSDLVCRLLL